MAVDTKALTVWVAEIEARSEGVKAAFGELSRPAAHASTDDLDQRVGALREAVEAATKQLLVEHNVRLRIVKRLLSSLGVIRGDHFCESRPVR